MSLKVALVSRDNGVGLSTDMQLLEGILGAAGHRVSRVDWRGAQMPRVDVAIFLELWSARLARYATKTVGVFNLEWFQNMWRPDLHKIDQLWAKSLEAHQIYRRLGLRTSTLTGFASRDLLDTRVHRERTALHLRGHSEFKNTKAVIDTWTRDPSLPELTIISNVPLDVPPHIRLLRRVSDMQLQEEMNNATFHICPSRSEGWGHYLSEALSVGALVIATDASPMNEHVSRDWGILIQPTSMGRRGMVTEYGVSTRALGAAIRQAAVLPDHKIQAMSKKAREHFEKRNSEFTNKALELLAGIL